MRNNVKLGDVLLATLILKPKYEFNVPVEVEKVVPNNIAGLSLKEVLKIRVYEGNRRKTLGELFEVLGEIADKPSEQEIIFQSSSYKIRFIGEEMTAGKIIVEGDAGPLAGFKMKGGTLIIKGNAGPWLGAKMEKGFIEVFGDAEGFVGSKLRGEELYSGMSGGMIIIHGNAGREVGAHMAGGAILVEGNVGVLPGMHMAKGEIMIKGNCAGWPGTHMVGGKIIILGKVESIAPSFYFEAVKKKAKFVKEKIPGPFYLFLGDVLDNIAIPGRLLISVKNNPHLKYYEQFVEEVKDEWVEVV